jgi:hypothetical protein
VSTPDFEINASIRAKRLVAHAPPDAQTRAEGDEVALARHEERSGVPMTIEAGQRYSEVVIDKRIFGDMRNGHQHGSAREQDGQPDAGEASDARGQQHEQGRRRSSSSQKKRGKKERIKPIKPSSKRTRPSVEQTTSKRKSSSPRPHKRTATATSSSAPNGLAEAVRNIDEAEAILREVRISRSRN